MFPYELFDILDEITFPYWAGLAVFLLLGCFPAYIADLLIFIISWCSDVASSFSNSIKRTLLNILTFLLLILSLVLFMVDFTPMQAKIEDWKELYMEDTVDMSHTLSGRVGGRFSRAMSIIPPSPSMMRF